MATPEASASEPDSPPLPDAKSCGSAEGRQPAAERKESASNAASTPESARNKPKRKQRKYYRLRIPEDGYMWLKYGQKPIRGTNIMRNYYRCSMFKDTACPAKRTIDFNIDDLQELEIIHAEQHNHGLRDAATRAKEAGGAFASRWGPGHMDASSWLDLQVSEMGALRSLLSCTPYESSSLLASERKLMDFPSTHLEEIKKILEDTKPKASSLMNDRNLEVFDELSFRASSDAIGKEQVSLEKELRDLYRIWFTLTEASWHESTSEAASDLAECVAKTLLSKTAGLPAEVVAEALMEGRILAVMGSRQGGLGLAKRRRLSPFPQRTPPSHMEELLPGLVDSVPLPEALQKPTAEANSAHLLKTSWGTKVQSAEPEGELFGWLRSARLMPNGEESLSRASSDLDAYAQYIRQPYDSLESSQCAATGDGRKGTSYPSCDSSEKGEVSLEALATMALNAEASGESQKSPSATFFEDPCGLPPLEPSELHLCGLPSTSSCSWELDSSSPPGGSALGDPLSTLGGQDSLRIADFIRFRDHFPQMSANVY